MYNVLALAVFPDSSAARAAPNKPLNRSGARPAEATNSR
jgi:hypothetical protein